MALMALAAGNATNDGWAIVASTLLVGVLAALGNLYVQRTHTRAPGVARAPLRVRQVMLPFVVLKMVLDGLVYSLWIRWLDDWGLAVWAKVAITSGLYTPIYYVLFFYGMELLALGPREVLSPRHLGDFSRRIWLRLKPVWRVDFWYFLLADGASFYGGPWLVSRVELSAAWNNQAVFGIFCVFDFFWDVLLSRTLHRGDGVLNERQVCLEVREAAARLGAAIQRRRRRRREP